MGRLSEKLFERTRRLWDEAAKNPFIIAMAEGTLDERRFKSYLLQDYYYLEDYIGILVEMCGEAKNPETKSFLKTAEEATRSEKDTFHVSNMKRLGITDAEIQKGIKAPGSIAYLNYMRRAAGEGTLEGLTALLQCSWIYAYIAQSVMNLYRDDLDKSPYAGWFYAYTSEEYATANKSWIDLLDFEAQDIDGETTEKLCSIFENCARFENNFWNIFNVSVDQLPGIWTC